MKTENAEEAYVPRTTLAGSVKCSGQIRGGTLITEKATEVWEGEGGALRRTSYRLTAGTVEPRLVPQRRSPVTEKKMTGTANQANSTERIRTEVKAESNRVAKALESAAGNQADQKRMETLSVIAILEEKWAEVMAKDHARYFMHEWHELREQVRRMIVQDSRYQAIKANRAAR